MSIKTITEILNEYFDDSSGKLRFNTGGNVSINILENCFEDIIATVYNDFDRGIDTVISQNVTNAANTIRSDYEVIRLVPNANRILTSTPTIEAGSVDNIVIELQGIADTYGVTIQDERTLTGSSLILSGGVSFTLGKYDTMKLRWNNSLSKWIEISRSGNSGS